jgi:hypothetical protein
MFYITIYLPNISGVGTFHCSLGIECGVYMGSGFSIVCLIKLFICVGEKFIQSPTLGNTRPRIKPLYSPLIGHCQKYKSETPAKVFTFFSIFLFGSK